MYASGNGVPKDCVQAHMWRSLAAAQGHDGSRHNLELLEKKMSPEQITEAQRLAREWKPR
jgi:TPR repeat protein